MKKEYIAELTRLLSELKDNEGHFIIQNGSFYEHNPVSTVYFCQLMTYPNNKLIRYEALSHHFDEGVSIALSEKFFELGFTLEEGENYAKDIVLNSNKDVETIADEIRFIFEEIYKVDSDSIYDFDDQIEKVNETIQPTPEKSIYTSNAKKSSNANTVKDKTNIKYSKTERNWAIAIIIIIAIVLFNILSPETKTSSDVWVVTQTTYVATSQESFREMFRYINNRDEQALNSLMFSGTVRTLSPGTELFLVRGGFTSSVVRVKGSRQELWIVNEHMSQKR